jgi:dCTP deaminase
LILSGKEILKAIKAGRIKITPFEKKNVGACSVDLRLGSRFRVFGRHGHGGQNFKRVMGISEDVDPGMWSEIVDAAEEGIIICPDELVLGTTHEKIKLGNDVCGRIEGRSRFARMGLLVHISSSLVQPGVDNVQVLEIINMSPFKMVLKPGIRICQMVFEEIKGTGSYFGKFKRQTEP